MPEDLITMLERIAKLEEDIRRQDATRSRDWEKWNRRDDMLNALITDRDNRILVLEIIIDEMESILDYYILKVGAVLPDTPELGRLVSAYVKKHIEKEVACRKEERDLK